MKTISFPDQFDVLNKPSGYNFFTKLDISMQHYTFKLHEESQGFFTINSLFSKHKNSRLLMGLTCSPDIAQAIMENNLASTKDADVYDDCIDAFSKDWKHNMQLL